MIYLSVKGEVYHFVSYTYNRDGKCCLLEKEYTNPGEEKKIKIYTIDYAKEYLYQTYLWGEPAEVSSDEDYSD